MNVSVREMKQMDVEVIADYFRNASSFFLKGMGADKNKLPSRKDWIEKIRLEIETSIEVKEFYYIIWEINNEAVGHSNINKIVFGETATMHLHLWKENLRNKGVGVTLLKKTIPFYFRNFNLKKLICEPYALNPAPNKVLPKVGFTFIKNYMTTPGWINFYQSVNRYEMTRQTFHTLFDNR
ncbi:GNAT family protein [Aquimarina sp. 2201CG1-2-11]|uniref:GNAT family N-acetyltransferase n=1 Tax=Aquimarina discodermiae TaxID=3231043 RepID=UPI003461EA3F